MELKTEFTELVENLKNERDEIILKLHLASMEVKAEFETIEQKLDSVSKSCTEMAEETSDEVIGKAKLIGEEIKESYRRIRSILSE